MVHKPILKELQAVDPSTTSNNSSPKAANSTLYNLWLLGRIPFCLEATLWCTLGNVIFASQQHTINYTTLLLSSGLVLLTNVSINYANEYFDFEADSIVSLRADDRASHGGSKMLVDGTFARPVALYCAASVQLFVLASIVLFRWLEGDKTSLQGVVLWFGLGSMVAAQQYVGPPLRLHYNGGGEVISSMEIAPGPVLYGFLSQVTRLRETGLTASQAFHAVPDTLKVFLIWAFVFEVGRIFMMHAADITEDRMAKKHTLVSVVGFQRTKALYRFALFAALLLAWNLILRNPKSAWLMGAMATYSLPIAYLVDERMEGLAACERERREIKTEGFTYIPAIVSLQTMVTPAVFMLVIASVGDCLA